MKSKIFTFILMIVIGMVLVPCTIQAAAVGTTPGRLYFNNEVGLIQKLNVVNTGKKESMYRVYAEGNYNGWFTFYPREFSIKAGDSRTVDITLAPPDGVCGEYTANVCVVAMDGTSDLNVGAGVKVPALINLIETKIRVQTQMPVIQWWLIVAIIVPLLLIAVIFFIWLRRKRVEVV